MINVIGVVWLRSTRESSAPPRCASCHETCKPDGSGAAEVGNTQMTSGGENFLPRACSEHRAQGPKGQNGLHGS